MTEVKILIKGWTNSDSLKNGEEENDACTTSLIVDGQIIAIVDPGVAADQQVFEKALEKEGLGLKDITHVFLTHSHIDHFRNVGIFEANVPVVEYWGKWTGSKVEDRENDFSENIKIIETPGHNRDSLTFIVNTGKGKVAICGDVFWKEGKPANDPYADNPELLAKSRQKILEIADFVIPGHGNIYKVKK
jgi:glyoxylase-like metal-dependent hydrolase (beta-lactamase superfamily II)